MWELEWTFGDHLRKARRVLGLSMEDVAATLGVSKQAVSSMETRPGTPRGAHATARRLELAYGVPAWWMLGMEMPTTDDDGGPAAPPTGLEPVTLWLTDDAA